MNEYKTKLTPEEREEMRERQRQDKVSSRMKFATISEMKQQHAAIKVLHRNGYDPSALQAVSNQFLDSVSFAMREIEAMRDNMQQIANNPY